MQSRKDSLLQVCFGIAACVLSALVVAGCSTRKNTRGTRFYHAMTTRFNVYFNGNEAYKEGLKEQEDGNKDNYMEMLPLYPVGNKETAALGGGNFDRAIEKAQKAIRRHSIKRKPTRRPGRAYSEKYKRWLSRKEFNPFMHNAWMLLGKAQYQKGSFEEAAATFSYIARLYQVQPEISSEAMIWQARCYSAMGWFYDAEDVLGRVNSDSLPASLNVPYTSAMASSLLEGGRFREAIPYVQQTARHERSSRQKARNYYLLGQLYQHTGQTAEAYDAFRRVVRLSPPYELELSARIRQTEVMPATSDESRKKVVKRLEKLARQGKNEEYLDQIYYALGNVHLAGGDTAEAVKAYCLGVEKSTRSGVEKGIVQLSLGNLYWDMGEFSKARDSYADAIGLLGQEHEAYKEVMHRSEVLDALTPHTEAIELQDSLQTLAAMPEEERMKVIENIIAEVKKREEAERKAAEEAEMEARRQQALETANALRPQTTQPTVTAPTGGKQEWYFYNPQLVQQGKQEFLRTWGNRKLEDNWRRRNKTVVSLDDFEEIDYSEDDEAAADSLGAGSAVPDSLAATPGGQAGGASPDSVANQLHDPQYYLAQIPLTEEAMQQSNALLADGLFNAGVIFREQMHSLSRSKLAFDRLVTRFPDYAQADVAYYHLFLLELEADYRDSANGPLYRQRAEAYRDTLLRRYPDSRYARILSDPDFTGNAMYGRQREDSLYALTYRNFLKGDYAAVTGADSLSALRYPLGKNRPKFVFLDAAVQLQQGNRAGFLEGLKTVVQEYPDNEITDLAAHILKGVQEGRLLQAGANSFGSIWERRSAEFEVGNLMGDSLGVLPPDSAFSGERNAPFVFLLAYEEGKVNEDMLLYEVASYNFSTFLVKNFDMEFTHERGIGMLVIRPFSNYDEAHQYFRRLYADPHMAERLAGMRAVLISEDNYATMLRSYSFDDYDAFYRKHFSIIPELELKGYTLDEPLQNLPEEKPEDEGGGESDEEGGGVEFDDGGGAVDDGGVIFED